MGITRIKMFDISLTTFITDDSQRKFPPTEAQEAKGKKEGGIIKQKEEKERGFRKRGKRTGGREGKFDKEKEIENR